MNNFWGNKKTILTIIENASSYVVTLAMLLYGIGKPLQFVANAYAQKRVGELTGMELMWAFYGYSKPFIIIVGLLEITGGLLLLFKKTRIVGCLMLSTILINVILQDIFYGVNQGALIAALFYQTLIGFILFLNREKLIAALKVMTSSSFVETESKAKWIVILGSIALFIALRLLEYLITH